MAVVRSYTPWMLAGIAIVGLEICGVIFPRPTHRAAQQGAPIGDAGCAYLYQYGKLHGYPPIDSCSTTRIENSGNTAKATFKITSQGSSYAIDVTFVRSAWQVTAAGIAK